MGMQFQFPNLSSDDSDLFFLLYLFIYELFYWKLKLQNRQSKKVEIWRYNKSMYEVVHLRFWRRYVSWFGADAPKTCDNEV